MTRHVDLMRRARSLAETLIGLLENLREFEIAELRALEEEDWQKAPGWHRSDLTGEIEVVEEVQRDGDIEALHECYEALDNSLIAAEYDGAFPNPGAHSFWSFGRLSIWGEPRKIIRGRALPVLSIPMLPPPTRRVCAFLHDVGDGDFLERENHGHSLIHYHYLDNKERRSDLICCWDVHQVCATPETRNLFWERHGEGKSKFKSNPHRWGPKKRRSMRDACARDFSKTPNCPSSEHLALMAA